MDFGALHCKPQNPLCESCVFNNSCIAFQKKTVKDLPVKDKKIKVRKRYLNYLVMISKDEKTILSERKGKGIWQGLYEFPFIESAKTISLDELILTLDFVKLVPSKSNISLYNKKEIVHKLSHQHLHTQFWVINTKNSPKITVKWEELDTYPVPVLIANFLASFQTKK